MNPKYSLTAAYYCAFILLGFAIAAEGATLLQLAENTSSTLDQISLIFFFGSLGYLIGSSFSGKLYDRLPGHAFMAVVFVVLGIAIALVPVAATIWMLLVVVFVLPHVCTQWAELHHHRPRGRSGSLRHQVGAPNRNAVRVGQ